MLWVLDKVMVSGQVSLSSLAQPSQTMADNFLPIERSVRQRTAAIPRFALD
jgi:hypothetical protein